MKQEEKRLLIELCSFKSTGFDEELLQYMSPAVLGHLFYNRMQGIAYGRLKESGLLGKVNREVRNSLKDGFEKNLERNKSFFQCVKYLKMILGEQKGSYAMLKGALLCKKYPDGYRTSNDIDLLVRPSDVTKIGDILLEEGFKQGYIRNGEFLPATRKEIIESKMMRGETVPYIKKVSLPGMKYLEVDINFSLDYKNGDDAVLCEMLDRTVVETIDGYQVWTLNRVDFFIHLCAHLYKEATTMPWVEMKRDMTLYKYCDIYLLLTEMMPMHINSMFERACKRGLEYICAFVIKQTCELFGNCNEYALARANLFLKNPKCAGILDAVISPKDNKQYTYMTKDIMERFFLDNRAEDLVEVEKNETT